MRKIRIDVGLMLVFSFILALIGISCTSESSDDSDDDDNDVGDDDDSGSGECHQVINPEADEAKASAMSYSSADAGDCLPELPDPIHEELLTALLNAYLGQYHSEIGTIRTITCRPEGEWVVPNFEAVELWCDYDYIFPIWIELEEFPGLYEGNIRQYAPFDCTIGNLFNSPSSIYFDLENDKKGATCSIEEYVVWEFGYAGASPPDPPDEDKVGFITWTKDEPFEE